MNIQPFGNLVQVHPDFVEFAIQFLGNLNKVLACLYFFCFPFPDQFSPAKTAQSQITLLFTAPQKQFLFQFGHPDTNSFSQFIIVCSFWPHGFKSFSAGKSSFSPVRWKVPAGQAQAFLWNKNTSCIPLPLSYFSVDFWVQFWSGNYPTFCFAPLLFVCFLSKSFSCLKSEKLMVRFAASTCKALYDHQPNQARFPFPGHFLQCERILSF